ncbi:MAG: hypothetical protein KVP17_001023 [Porospora cf. gigantea B]|uniref:uncharacterized protein n=1 Tax=Porospora cf. gigantea B TaxID=2853592 RepID=UPI0035719275|nr:MAG: hypothetical protein KVP17_001023 [Porospora cf. gigantea B]
MSVSEVTPLLVDILQKSLRSQRYYQNGKPIKTPFREYQTSKAQVFSKVVQTLTESIGTLQQAHKVIKHEVTVLAGCNSACKRQRSAAINAVSKSRCRYEEKTSTLLHLIELRRIARSRAAQGIVEVNPTYVTDARLKEELMAHVSLEEQLDVCLLDASQLSARSDESLLQLLDTSSQVLESACLSPLVAAIEASIRAILSGVSELTALAVTTLAGVSVHDEADLGEGMPSEAVSVEEWLTYIDRLLGPFSSSRKRLGALVETVAPTPRRFSTVRSAFSCSSRTLNDLCTHCGAAAQLYDSFLRRFHEKTQLSLCQAPLAEAGADAQTLLALRDSLKSRKETKRPRKSEYCSLSSMDSLNLLDEVSVAAVACLERHNTRNAFISNYLRTTTASLLQIEAATADKLKQLLAASTEVRCLVGSQAAFSLSDNG